MAQNLVPLIKRHVDKSGLFAAPSALLPFLPLLIPSVFADGKNCVLPVWDALGDVSPGCLQHLGSGGGSVRGESLPSTKGPGEKGTAFLNRKRNQQVNIKK